MSKFTSIILVTFGLGITERNINLGSLFTLNVYREAINEFWGFEATLLVESRNVDMELRKYSTLGFRLRYVSAIFFA